VASPAERHVAFGEWRCLRGFQERSMSKISVLVVDDAPFIRDLVKKCLRNAFPGIVVEDAVNGRKAQSLMMHNSYDMVLCDWEMPEMSGLELLTWTREQENSKTLPFIMVTSRGDKENVVQAIQAGVSDYIGKPFTNEQLMTKVKKALAKVGKLQALAAGAPTRQQAASAFANDSLSALTSGRAEPARPVAPAPRPAAAAPASTPARRQPAVRDQGPEPQGGLAGGTAHGHAASSAGTGGAGSGAGRERRSGASQWLSACRGRVRAQTRQRLAAAYVPFSRPGCAEAGLCIALDRPRLGAEAFRARCLTGGTLPLCRYLLIWTHFSSQTLPP
jgi:CheY-like chemotaxis protein